MAVRIARAGEAVPAPARRADGEARQPAVLRSVAGSALALDPPSRHAPAVASASMPPAPPCSTGGAWLPRAALTTSRRATPLTSSVSTNSTRPGGEQRRAVQALGLAELVGDHRREAVSLGEQMAAEPGSVADQDRHGDRLADRPPETEHRPADDARAAVRQHGDADHLPARGPQAQRRLLMVGWARSP